MKNNLRRMKQSFNNGITLIALVITIIVLLILAGVSIAMLTGENGILTKSSNAIKIAEEVEAIETVRLVLNEWQIEKNKNNITLGEFLNNKFENGQLDGVRGEEPGPYEIEKIVDRTTYIVTVNENGIIIQEQMKETVISPKVSDIKIVKNSDGTGENIIESGSVEEGEILYINFTHEIKGGETTVSPELPYAVKTNGTYKFTIIGNVNGKEYTKNIEVNVNQFNNILKIGDYVKYNVTYKDMYTKYDFKENNGWRVLEVGTKNQDGTYNDVKIISTGIPAKLNYVHGSIKNATWAGTEKYRTDYVNEFGLSYSISNKNIYAAAGLYYNFINIPFEYNNTDDNISTNTVGYLEIQGRTEATNGSIFLADGATEVRCLTVADINVARTTTTGIEYSNDDRTDVRTVDAAIGLFDLIRLEAFGYNSNVSYYYRMATPFGGNADLAWYLVDVFDDGRIAGTNSTTFGIRPVISLPDNFRIEESVN